MSKNIYIIRAPLPDGVNYCCGISQITPTPEQMKQGFINPIPGIEWSLDPYDSEIYIDKETCEKFLKDNVIEENPMAFIQTIKVTEEQYNKMGFKK